MLQALYQDKSNSIEQICDTLHISRATLYRYVKPASWQLHSSTSWSVQIRPLCEKVPELFLQRSIYFLAPQGTDTTFVWVVVICAWATVLEMYRVTPSSPWSNHFQK